MVSHTEIKLTWFWNLSIVSLYGLKQAPKAFYNKSKEGLIEIGFTTSTIHSCLFMKHNLIYVVYVDDTIFAGPDAQEIEKTIKRLGVSNDETE